MGTKPLVERRLGYVLHYVTESIKIRDPIPIPFMILKGEIFSHLFLFVNFFYLSLLKSKYFMVNTIHKSVVEKLQVELQDTNDSLEPNLFGVNGVKSTRITQVNEDVFKEALKNNQPCWVHRETFIVEHDVVKNKIIFKKYNVRKHCVEIKKFKTLKLKTSKSYKSLSIDISNGEFSIYSAETSHRRNKRSTPVIRKNIFSWKVLTVIEGIFEVNLLNKSSVIEGLNKGIQILGYNDGITSMLSDSFLKRIFQEDEKKIRVWNYATIFIMYNYFKKLDISLPNDVAILNYAYSFRNNKKSYSGKSMYTYYANHFGTDEGFIGGLLDYKDQLNAQIYQSNKNKESSEWFFDSNIKPAQVKEPYYCINEEGVTILYKLGYTLSDIKSSTILLNMVYARDSNLAFYKNPLELPVDILVENKEFFRSILKDSTIQTIINTIKIIHCLRSLYGISISASMVYSMSFDNVMKSLDTAVEETGLYVVSKGFLNRLKKQLPKNAKCSVTKHINKKITPDSSIFPHLKNNSDNICATIHISYKSEKMRLMVYEDYIHHRIYGQKISLDDFGNVSKDSVLNKAFAKFNRNYNKNKNKFRYAGLKAHYSKKRFEQLLQEKCSDKSFKYFMENVVYLT